MLELNAVVGDAIRAVNLTKRYGRILALDACDLALPEGSFTALVGPNGAGKSTLLLTLVGLLKPTAGDVAVFGFDPHKQRREALGLIGFMSQDRPLYRSLTVSETMEMGRRLNPGWDTVLATRRLQRLGISLDSQVGQLSGGQQAQVSLSLALGKRPALLLLDEPMASLDPMARHLFLQELSAVAREHRMTIIMSSHILAELGRVCDHLTILEGGRVKLCGRVEDAIARSPHRVRDASASGLTDLEQAVLGYLSDDRRHDVAPS